jgi:hypothetical protein
MTAQKRNECTETCQGRKVVGSADQVCTKPTQPERHPDVSALQGTVHRLRTE